MLTGQLKFNFLTLDKIILEHSNIKGIYFKTDKRKEFRTINNKQVTNFKLSNNNQRVKSYVKIN